MKHSDSGAQSQTLRETFLISLLLLLIFGFYTFTLRQGHVWGDDFAMYIHHGENIALHRAYAATGYIYNLREAWYGPREYPPVFPLLLAPVIRVFGLNFAAMKMEEVVAFTLSLATLYLLFRDEMRFPYMAALLLLIGFNPFLWDMKDSITSDYPFVFFFLAAALLMEKAPREGKSVLLWGLATGLAIYLCYGTRGVGLMLFPGFMVYEAIRYRKATRFGLVTIGVAVLLVICQRVSMGGSESSYAEQFRPSVRTIVENLHDYLSSLASFWPWSAGRIPAYLLFLLFTLLAGYGAFQSIRRHGIRPFEPTLLFYVALIVIWPGNQGLRFLLPLLFIYLAYAMVGLSSIMSNIASPVQWGALGGLVLFAGALYAGDYRKQEFRRIQESIGSVTFNDMCRFVKQGTRADDVFVAYRARALSLFTDRPASVYFLEGTPALYDEQWQYFRNVGVRYVVYSRLHLSDRKFLKAVLDRHSSAVEPVYHNSDFVVYRLAPHD